MKMNKEHAKKLFSPYAKELNFDERDWEVFLNRILEIYKEGVRHAELFKHRNRLCKCFKKEREVIVDD